MKRLSAILPLFVFTSLAFAQSATPYLQGVFPPGCKAGASAKLSLRGGNLDGITALHFSHPGIKAELTGGSATVEAVAADPKAKATKRVGAPAAGVSGQVWTVTVGADVPTGLHEIRVVSRNGISNARAFTVSSLKEVNEAEPNDQMEKAQAIEIDSIVNGQTEKTADVDWYKVKLAKGRRTVIECVAERIDSKMSPSIQLYDPAGKPLISNSYYSGTVRSALIDFTPPADGEYRIKVWDFIFQGTAIDYYYRLSVGTLPQIEFTLPNVVAAGKASDVVVYGRNLAGGQPAPEAVVNGLPLEKVTVKVTPPAANGRGDLGFWLKPAGVAVQGFEYRIQGPGGWSNPVLIGVTDNPIHVEKEPNDKADAGQVVTVPAEIVGQFGGRGDIDVFRFEAKRGDAFRIEVICARVGTVGDPVIFIGQYAATTWSYLQELVDDDATVFGVTPQNATAKFDARSEDPRVLWTAPADGKFFIQIQDLYGAGRGDCRFVYRLSVRKSEPDYRLAVIHTEEARSDAVTVRQGGHQAYQLLCGRYDGFNETIKVEVKGLPAGVACAPVYLGPNVNQAPLIFSADEKAALWAGPIRVTGTATVAGKPLVREAVGAMLVQEGGAQGQGPRTARITRDIVLAVADTAPFSITTDPKEISVVPGGKADVKIKVTRRAGFDDAVTLLNFDTAQLPIQQQQVKAVATIAKGKDEVVYNIAVPKTYTYGTYTQAVLGQGTAQLSTNPTDPKSAKKATKIGDPSNAITVNVTAPFEFKTGPMPAKLAAGETVEIAVTVKRIPSVTEDIKVDLTVPKGRGLTVEPAVLAKGASEGKIKVKADAKAAAGAVADLRLVGSVTVNGNAMNVTHPAMVTLEVVPGAAAPTPKPVEKPAEKPKPEVKTPPKTAPKTPAAAGNVPASVTALIESLKGGRDAKVKAATALGELGPAAKDAVPALTAVVANETSGTVIRTAAAALARIGAAAKPSLPKLKAVHDGTERQEVKAALAEAIKLIEAAK